MVNIYAPTANDDLSATELTLYHAIMDYRADNGLGAIPLSKALTTTAGRHAVDSYFNIFKTGLVLPPGTNLHSWSDAPYYADHSQPEVMWEAPARLGTGYTGNGFEISAAGFSDVLAALAGFQGSPAHDAVILNEGVWAPFPWTAIGIGVEIHADETFYHVWFGFEVDPTGVATITGSNAAETLDGTEFGDRVLGQGGADTIRGDDGIDTIYGGGGSDRLYGDAANDRIDASTGDDRVYGGDGNDKLYGGDGNDTVAGGAGRDSVSGGEGDDLLQGQGAEDRFVFDAPEGADVIADFADGIDRIVLGDGTGMNAWTDVRDELRAVASGVRLTFAPGESVLLQGATLADFGAGDFIFV